MAYSDFTLENVIDQFEIVLESGILFDSICLIERTMCGTNAKCADFQSESPPKYF